MNDKQWVTIFITTIVILGVFGLVGAISNWYIGMEAERNVDYYLDYADQASDAKTKSEYFNKYVEALEKYKLTEGCNSVWFCEQPEAQLKDKFIVAKSIQLRLNELKLLDEKDTAYQLGMTQITENEIECFPSGSFHQKYMLMKGAWGAALTPARTPC